jgi:plastocyanin
MQMKNHLDTITFRALLIISLFLIILSIAGLGISCQSQSSAPAPAPPASSLPTTPTPGASPATPPQIEVAIEGFAFNPAQLNDDSAPHTATARDNSFESGSLSKGDTFSYTFEQRGIIEYYCRFHPSMTGKIVVE